MSDKSSAASHGFHAKVPAGRILRLLVIIFLLLTGGIAAGHNFYLIACQGAPAPEPACVRVLVARKGIDMGTYFIDPQKYFTVKEFEPGDEPKNAVSHYELLKDKYIKRSVPRGDHVTPEDLVERARLTWPWPFPEYHRAIGLRVYADDLPGGLQCLASWSSFVGSRVNLFARATKDDGTSIELQFEDVLVLAADRIGDKSVDVNSRPLALVTFSLTSEDAIKVTLASHIGRFRVAVRYANDK